MLSETKQTSIEKLMNLRNLQQRWRRVRNFCINIAAHEQLALK